MRIIISPAKKLHSGTALTAFSHTKPLYLEQSQQLIQTLQEKDSFEIASLMRLSVKLSDLNVQRFQQWHTPFTTDNARQALFTFAGDVYQGLDAATLSVDDINFAQNKLRILSGLYGLLRPLDLIQAYRLEMGTKLRTHDAANLYEFWGTQLTQQLNQELETDSALINLASHEYAKVIQSKHIHCPVITPIFKNYKNDTYKIIGIYAKRARGFMSRYIIEQRIQEPEAIKGFNQDGYRFNARLSDAKDWVFTKG